MVTIKELMDNMAETLGLIMREEGNLNNLDRISSLMHTRKNDKFYEGYYSVRQVADALKENNIDSLELDKCILVTQERGIFICKHY